MKKVDIKGKIGGVLNPGEKYTEGFKLISKYRSAIMGFAALWILFFHEWCVISTKPVPNHLETRFVRFGYGGVDIFFLLSGIGLTYAIQKSNLITFYYRRLKRLIMPFLTIAFIRMHLESWTMDGLIDDITGRGFYKISIYCFLWFIPAIVTFYIFFPIYWKIFKVVGPYICTVSALIIWLLWTLSVKDTLRGDLFGFTNRIPVFLIGIFIGYLTQTRGALKFRRRAYLPIALGFWLGLRFLELTNFWNYFLLVPTSNCCIPTLLVAVTLPFLMAKALNELECHKGFCVIGHILTGVLKWFGGFSLELYCLQEWFANTVLPDMREKGWSDLKVNLVLFSMIIVISFVGSVVFKYFWRLIELPFRKYVFTGPRKVRKPAFEAKAEDVVITDNGAQMLSDTADRIEAAVERLEKAAEKISKTAK